MTSLLHRFVAINQRLSLAIDRLLLPERMRLDGNGYFKAVIVPSLLKPGLRVYDLGGGSNPYLDVQSKTDMNLYVVGLDISQEELNLAPPGAYDLIIAADLCSFRGPGDADLVICQATLEHVTDTKGAIKAIAETLRPGGVAAIFMPSRNAVFARLNLTLPEKLKRYLLFTFFPSKALGHDGFRAFYDCCTPAEIEAIASENKLEVKDRKLFWISSYFTIFVPAFISWRIFQGLAYLFIKEQSAETFCYILRKPTQ